VWADGSTPRLPSRFLTELVGHPAVTAGPQADLPAGPDEANPRTLEPFTRGWPADPLGPRRPDVDAGAQAVMAALAAMAELPDIPQQVDATQPAAGPDRWSWEATALLAERDAGRDPRVHVLLPSHVSASRLVRLSADPQGLALDLRRPVPQQPRAAARRGTAFHAWVEQRLGAAAIVDVLDLPGAADDDPARDEDLAELQRHFLASEWADRPVVAVEVPIETPVDGTVVRGRVDAVLGRPDGGVDVVDWKTGPPPSGAAARARAVQLAVYRLAWSRLHGLPLDRVGAAFFYAATGETVRPVDLLDEQGLVDLLRSVDVGQAS
jgi:DNA helicase-2/ATP-dependent DNA helicase PcrA